MSTIDREASGPRRILLPAALDLTAAPALKTQLQAALAAGDGLTLDASLVSRATSPCLQVVAAGKRAFTSSGGPGLVVANPSEAFFEVVTGLDLAGLFELEEASGG